MELDCLPASAVLPPEVGLSDLWIIELPLIVSVEAEERLSLEQIRALLENNGATSSTEGSRIIGRGAGPRSLARTRTPAGNARPLL
jgi:hypothetical protein